MTPGDPPRSIRVHWSLTRLHASLQALVDSAALRQGGTVLDYGCGDRPYESLFLRKFHLYVGADLPGNSLADLAIGVSGELPARNESVDCVLSSQVLEHVDDPRIYLSEAFRVLRPGGCLIISTHGIWPYHPHPTDYWRWTKDGLERELSRAGFQLVSTESVFGPETAALQFWQDVTFGRVPRPFRLVYVRLLQSFIGFIEKRRVAPPTHDASIYVSLARKPEAQAR